LEQTALFVTHDLSEAITLGDRVVVLSGPPSRVLLDQPVTLPRQRDVFTLRESDEFIACFKTVWHVLGREFRAGEPDAIEARPAWARGRWSGPGRSRWWSSPSPSGSWARGCRGSRNPPCSIRSSSAGRASSSRGSGRG